MGKNYFIYLSIGFVLIVPSLGSNPRLVGGHEAPEIYGLFHASLQNTLNEHVCGGAIISLRHIITAAHCIAGAEPQYIRAVVGTSDIDKGGKRYQVCSVYMHEGYNVTLRTNDIAIVQIKCKFNLNLVKILPVSEEELVVDEQLVLSSFGSSVPNGATSRQLQALNVTVFNQDICKFAMRYTREVFDTMFCTFTQIGEGTCHGDSGSPIIRNNELVGLVSWGIPCAVGFPDVHTRITPYISWIKNIIGN